MTVITQLMNLLLFRQCTGYFVPHSIYPNGYHCNPKEPLPFVGVGNTKGHVCIYLFCIYTNESTVDAFRKDWIATGKRLDMGKSCVRVKKIQDLAMDVLGKTIKSISLKDFLAQYKSGKNHGKGLQKTKVKSSSRKEPEIKNMKVHEMILSTISMRFLRFNFAGF